MWLLSLIEKKGCCALVKYWSLTQKSRIQTLCSFSSYICLFSLTGMTQWFCYIMVVVFCRQHTVVQSLMLNSVLHCGPVSQILMQNFTATPWCAEIFGLSFTPQLATPPPQILAWTPCVLEGWVKTILDYPSYKSLSAGQYCRTTVHVNIHSLSHTRMQSYADLRGGIRATRIQLSDKEK